MIKLVGLTCFSVESIPLLFPILNRMKKKEDFNRYFVTVSFSAISFTSLMGVLVYYKMGDKISKIYLTNLASEYAIIRWLLIFYGISLFLNTIYLMFPVYQIVIEERKYLTKAFDVSLPPIVSD